MEVDTLRGDWSFGAGASTGDLNVAARGIEFPTGRLERIELAARGAMERSGFAGRCSSIVSTSRLPTAVSTSTVRPSH